VLRSERGLKTGFAGRPLSRGRGKEEQCGGFSTPFVICGAAVVAPAGAGTTAPAVLSGGGTGTFDGVYPGSQVGVGVVFGDGSVRGHLNCVMAGRFAAPGLRLLKVGGQVIAGSAKLAGGTATFSGTGSVHSTSP
jgi:hypothetical protein